MIDHVMLMNLKRREDKWFFALGALRVADFPIHHETIIRFLSHDSRKYNRVSSVIKAAVDDGFPYFTKYTRPHDPLAKRVLAWQWTWASALRRIVRMNRCVMLLIDDFVPAFNWKWFRYKKLVEECYQLNSDFKGLQMRTNSKAQTVKPAIKPYTSMLGEGFYGSNENALILTKAGAEILLELHAENFPDEGNRNTNTLSQRGLTDEKYKKGFWHTLEPIVDGGGYDFKSDLWKT